MLINTLYILFIVYFVTIINSNIRGNDMIKNKSHETCSSNACLQHTATSGKTGNNEQTNNIKIGILCIITSGFFFSLMTFFVRLSGDLPTMQKAFFRNAVAAVIAVVMLLRSPEGFKIKKTSWPSLAMRCICGTSGLICNFYAIDHMNLADANMLNKLSPFFAIIASQFVLGETAGAFEWILVIIAFSGSLFIIKPSFDISFLYGIIGTLGGLGAGVAYSYVRKLGRTGERTPIIVMCFSVFSCIVTMPFMIVEYKPMSASQLSCLVLAGVTAAIAQICITTAYKKAPAKDISVFDYTQILFAALWGFLFLDQIPDVFSCIGYFIIIGCAVIKFLHAKSQK